jgi:GNAT superfamily N-acetyltransferase
MDDDTAARTAGQCHRALEPLHVLVYFAPEAAEKLVGVGLRPGRMTYFASRAAAMGAVGPGTVAATFYNFNPEVIARHIPRAWTLATPEQVLDARLQAVDAALRRLLGDAVDSPEVAEAAGLAREASEACTPEGRPLYAGHADLDWPTEPHLVLWHAITLLREYRGDGHIAALLAHALDGLSALVTHTAAGLGFTESAAKLTRGWSDEEWAAAVERLQQQGLLDDAGKLTPECVALRESLEAATDRMAVAPWRHLGEEKSQRLRTIGKTLSRAVAAAGAFPAGTFAAR